MPPVITKKLSQAVTEPLITAYKTGGLGLTLLCLGTILLTMANVATSQNKLVMVIAGLALIAIPATFYLLKEVIPLAKASRNIEAQAELLDQFQFMSAELVELLKQTQETATRHCDSIAKIINEVAPYIAKLQSFKESARPLLSAPLIASIPNADKLLNLVDDHAISKVQSAFVSERDVALAILNASTQARDILDNIDVAIKNADPEKLKTHIADLHRFVAHVSELKRGIARP